MTQVNNYTFGPGSTTIYPTNGGSDDWMYGEQETKNKILAFTPEIGNSSDGFWPSPDRIIPHCQENLLMNILAAKFAGAYAAVYDRDESIIAETEGYLNFDIKRLGLTDGATYSVSAEALTDSFASVGEAGVFAEMELMETLTDSISYSFVNTILPGDSVQYVLAVDNGSSVSRDTLTKVYGTPTVVYENQVDQLEGFENDGWGFTAEDFTSGPYSITDSPNTNYGNNEYSIITITDTVDLTNAVFAQLSFEAKWDIEPGYDYVQVQISEDYGDSFTPLSGMHTVTGNSYQQEGEPVYDGIQNEWVTENISLTEFLGKEILFRFVFESDVGVTEDGFYFDDLMVNVLQQSGTSIQYQMDSKVMVKVFPNPAHEYVTFDITGDEKYDHIVLTNAQGKTVKSWKMSQSRETYAIKQLPAGYYFYIMRSENSDLQLRGKLIIR